MLHCYSQVILELVLSVHEGSGHLSGYYLSEPKLGVRRNEVFV